MTNPEGYPYRIDLKLPVDQTAFDERRRGMQEWINEHDVYLIAGRICTYRVWGYTHMTAWFKDKNVAMLFKLTWNGQ